MSKVAELKKEFIDGIKEILNKEKITYFPWSNFEEGYSPILQENEWDENNTYTLDSLDENGVNGSNCYNSLHWDYEDTPIEVLEVIYEHLSKFDMNEFDISKISKDKIDMTFEIEHDGTYYKIDCVKDCDNGLCCMVYEGLGIGFNPYDYGEMEYEDEYSDYFNLDSEDCDCEDEDEVEKAIEKYFNENY